MKQSTRLFMGLAPLVLLPALAAWGDDADPRTPPPAAAEVDTAEKLAREIFAAEYRAAKSDADKAALAKRILAAGMESTDRPAEQYVLFRVARDIAAAAGDMETALSAVEQLGRNFRVDSLEMKVAALDGAARKARSPAKHLALVPMFGKLLDEAIAAERFEVARQLGQRASASAIASRDVTARKQITAKLKQLDRLQETFAGVKQALAVLQEQPADPDANLAVGRYRCFSQGDWQRGLPMLALGSDSELQSLAEQELKTPTAASDQKKLGDGWWALADRRKGREQTEARKRAGHWYRLASAGLHGLEKALVAKRIEQAGTDPQTDSAEPTAPPTAPPTAAPTRPTTPAGRPVNVLQLIDIGKDRIKGDWRLERGVLLCGKEMDARIHIPYLPPDEYSLEIVATQLDSAKAFFIGLPGGGAVCTVVLDHNLGRDYGIGMVDGKGLQDGNPSRRPGKIFAKGRPIRITCHVHKTGVRVAVDGRMILDWRDGFERFWGKQSWSPKDPRLPYVGCNECRYAIHSIVLLPMSGPGETAHPVN